MYRKLVYFVLIFIVLAFIAKTEARGGRGGGGGSRSSSSGGRSSSGNSGGGGFSRLFGGRSSSSSSSKKSHSTHDKDHSYSSYHPGWEPSPYSGSRYPSYGKHYHTSNYGNSFNVDSAKKSGKFFLLKNTYIYNLTKIFGF